MTPHSSVTPNSELLRMEILRAYKKCYGRESGNVSPFRADRVARYHTTIQDYDVPDIHQTPRKRIREAILGIHEGQMRSVVILAGQPGIGKTHLINYFRNPELQAELGYILVCNSNHWAVKDFEKCLLGWVIDALAYPSPTGPNPLLDKVREIAYLALGQILKDREQAYRFLAKSPKYWAGKIWHRLTGAGLAKVTRLADAHDDRVFRHLDFDRFAGYVCDRFLAERHKVFHRYVMRVLLRYLFPEEREVVLHWLRGAVVDDHFLKCLRVREEVNTQHELIQTVKILISLFSNDVTAGLAGTESGRARGKAFVFAFDQTEGRDELFDSEDDWNTFFAQLSELYNDLPNVFILFTMTLGRRETLYPKIELQFQERVRHDPEFVLHEIADEEVLTLYRQRVSHWLAGQSEVRRKQESLGEPYLPFDQSTVLKMAQDLDLTSNPTKLGDRSLRRILDEFDRRFAKYMEEEVTLGPRYDYLVFQNSLRETEEQVQREFDYTASHLQTVQKLLNALGNPLTQRFGLTLHKTDWLKTQDDLPALYLEFHDAAEPKRWVVVYLVCLRFHYNACVEGCANLLSHKGRSRYQLWLLRPSRIDVDENTLREGYTVRARVLPPASETTFRAILRVHEKCPGVCEKQTTEAYDAQTWEKELPDLLAEVHRTYLGGMFESVRKMMQGPQEAVESLPGEGVQLDQPSLLPAGTKE